MSDEEIKQLAQECVDSMSNEDRLHLLAYPDFNIEFEFESETEIPQDKFRVVLLELLEPFAHNYLECSDWHLLSKEYLILADVEDLLSEEEQNRLEDKFEAFEIPWLKYPNGYWSIPENDKYGCFFIKVPKWKQDAAKRAFDSYYKWLCWKDPDFKQFCREVMYDLACGEDET